MPFTYYGFCVCVCVLIEERTYRYLVLFNIWEFNNDNDETPMITTRQKQRDYQICVITLRFLLPDIYDQHFFASQVQSNQR